MSAHDQIRAMLDQLMGTARNGDDDKITVAFDDQRVCKPFLLGCCQYEVLAATRMDLGECPKIHNLALKADYEAASKDKDYFYDLEAMEQLEAFVADADRKTEQARKRLAETQEELSAEVAQKADKVHELAERIGETLAKAESLGEEGLVDESMKLMEEIDNLRKQKSEAEAEYRQSIPAATYQQQKLRVCEVCCAYLGIHDNDRRLADHFGGKLHLGFIKIRETLKEFQVIAEERRRNRRDSLRNRRAIEVEERERGRRRRSRSKSKEKEKDSRSKRSRSRSKERRDRRRSRSRDRSQ
ncbi:putative RNA-binding protein Luc7-like 1 [Orchesella cincta]|uniref:Putative RNA-binding protein Luc7-like 1 n=1 Tax=Orchesella cincta TaxID=48709 RepID=A0A1D2NH96_ORCCI|nr:putative RNA-binding protein Luc7-like 1 [Orchesella cincta]